MGFGQWEAAVDQAPHPVLLHQVGNPGEILSVRPHKHEMRAGSTPEARQSERLGCERLGCTLQAGNGGDVAPARRQHLQATGEAVTPDGVEHEILVIYHPGEVLGLVVHDRVRSQTQYQVRVGAAGDAGDVCAERLGELDSIATYTTRCATNRHPADVILAHGPVAAATLHRETRTIPVVFASVGDPIGFGLPDPSAPIYEYLVLAPTTSAAGEGLIMQTMICVIIIALELSTVTTHAEPLPQPKPPGPGGSYPHGWGASGSYCVSMQGAQDAIPKPPNGNCLCTCPLNA